MASTPIKKWNYVLKVELENLSSPILNAFLLENLLFVKLTSIYC